MEKNTQNNQIISIEIISKSILLLRGQKVMLDADLARLYGVEVKALNRAIKRNMSRFPSDFMFQLDQKEFADLRYQFGTTNFSKKRYLPYAFTEYGVAMLSSVLNSERAIVVNIEIMRVFGKLRQILASNKELAERLNELEKKYDKRFRVVFEAIRELMEPPEVPKKPKIGFDPGRRVD